MCSVAGWGSIAPWYEEGEKPSPSYYPTKYQTLPRDTAGYTTFEDVYKRQRGTNYLIANGACCIIDEESIEMAISRIYGTLRYSRPDAPGLSLIHI